MKALDLDPPMEARASSLMRVIELPKSPLRMIGPY